ncbi:MAG: hypothetical protein QOI10_2194 [Solirubrobacterales bacterium]|nr:hypothetical protein [Solirubrobacterales bacterium]
MANHRGVHDVRGDDTQLGVGELVIRLSTSEEGLREVFTPRFTKPLAHLLGAAVITGVDKPALPSGGESELGRNTVRRNQAALLLNGLGLELSNTGAEPNDLTESLALKRLVGGTG